MASSANRTVTLTLNAETSGQQDIEDLANEIAKLGKKGGEAKPEFEALAGELEQLASQRGVINTFNELTDALTASRTALNAAKNSASEEAEKLRELKTALDAARAAEDAQLAKIKAATAARDASSLALSKARAEYSALNAAIGDGRAATDQERVALKEKTQAILDAKAAYDATKVALKELTPEFRVLSGEAGKAATAYKEQQAALNEAKKGVDAAQAGYEKLGERLDETVEKAKKVGVSLGNVASEQARVTKAVADGQNAFAALRTRLEETGNTALTAAQKIERAFAGTGVKAVEPIKAEILKINQALQRLASDTSINGVEFETAFSRGKERIAELERELNKTEGTAKKFGGSFGDAFRQFGPATLVFNGITAAINAIAGAATQIPKVTAEFQTMSRTLQILTGDSNKAAKEMEYIINVANRVGADIKGVGDGYIKLAAATKETNLAGAETRRIFEAVAGSMGVLGASSADTENALMAVTQMVSKGVVSMEEMRQQLGERLPGAFQATAKELGITTADLNDLISSGKLTAEDVLPALARGLENVYKSGSQNDTLIGKWRQFTNALKESANAMGSNGMIETMLEWGRIGVAVVQGMIEQFVFLGRAIGAVIAAIKTGDWKNTFAGLKEELDGINQRMLKTAGLGPKVQGSLKDAALAAKEAGQEFFVYGDGVKYQTEAVLKSTDGFIAFMDKSQKARNSAEGFATAARKVAESVRASGESANTAANALGNEIDKRNTATRVAEDNAKALENLVEKEKAVLAVMDAEAMKRAEAIRDNTNASDAHKKQLEDLGREIQERRTAVEGIERQAQANRLLAESLAIKAELEKDNSGRLAELRTLNTEYAAALERVHAAVKDGSLTTEQAAIVENEARKVKALYVDALQDQQEKIKSSLSLEESKISVERAGVNLQIERLKTQAEVAKAYGDEASAAYYLLEAKKLEIQLAELTAKAKRAEAEAALLGAKAKREELLASGQLTPAKEAEIKAIEASAKVKQVEADIATETASRLQQLTDATYAYPDAANQAADGARNFAGALDEGANSADRMANSLKKVSEAQKNVGNNTGDGVRNASGTSLGKVSSSQVDFTETFYRRGASIEEQKLAQKYVGELYQRNAATMPTGNLGNEQNAARLQKAAINDAVDKAIAAARTELRTGKAVDLGTSVNDIITRNMSQTQLRSGDDIIKRIQRAGNEAKSQTTTVKITIGGKTGDVNVASQQDAFALTNILKQLESDSTRTF